MNFMVNQMNKLQKNRKNKNKGFTLVELIIVIAILAILVAVLAPQYIKYVSKAQDGVVLSAANDVLSVAKTEAAIGAFAKDCTITISKDGVAVDPADAYPGTGATFTTMADAIGSDSDLKKSKSIKKYEITVTTSTKSAVKAAEWT